VPHSVVDELLYEARLYAARFGQPHSVVPDKHLAIVTCMDSRIDVFGLFGLAIGDAHIIRNAGGIVTDDVLRSLVLSQRVLRTREIILVHHTDCGMLTFTEDELRNELLQETGVKPPWSAETFTDLDADVRSSMQRIRTSPYIPHRDRVRGFVYDVDTGVLREVT
jgi:carbonic anhydrase